MKEKVKKYLSTFAVFLLAAIFIILSVRLINDFWSLKKSGYLKPARSLRRHVNAATPSPDQIQDWMTFSYINYVYRLPEKYLAEKILIRQPNYSNLTLNKYAKQNSLDSGQLLSQVKKAVKDYNTGVIQ